MSRRTETVTKVPGSDSPDPQEQTTASSAAGPQPTPRDGIRRALLTGRRRPTDRTDTTEPETGRGGDTIVYRTERKRSGFLTAALVVAVLLVSGALALNLTTGALDRINPFKGMFSSETIDRSGPAVLQTINDLGRFQAASGYYELVVDVEKDVKPVPSFLAGEHTLFIAAGTVDVGVDLSNLADGAVEVNDDRTQATITLPAPTLGDPVIDYDRSYVYSQDRGIFDRLKDAVSSDTDQTQQLYTLASQRLTEAAQETDDLTDRAEKNTRSTLQGLLEPLGFTDVTVNFTD